MKAGRLVGGLLVLVVPLFSGCFGAKGGTPQEVDASYFGTVTGQVLDDEVFPVAGARVGVRPIGFGLLELSSNSSDDGVFRIDRVPPGPLLLFAAKPGYAPSEERIFVSAGSLIERNLTLIAIPGATRRVAPQSTLSGHFQCAAEWAVEGGSCDALVPPPGPRPLNTTPDPVLPVPPQWGGVLLELKWQTSGPGNAIEGIRFEVLGDNGTARIAYSEGPGSVLTIRFDRGQPHGAADTNWTLPAEGGDVLLRVRPAGAANQATCAVQCYRGVGAVVELSYTIYPTFFFGSGADPSYSALTE